jgi:riboflavin synthase
MFSGIVRERGRVVSLAREDGAARLAVEAPATAPGLEIGDSVAIDGCCLTVVVVQGAELRFDLSPETLARTALGGLEPGIGVNVEPALRAGDPLGGHYVQGHVDAVGRVRSLEPEGEGARLRIEVPPQLLRYCVEKGSIAVAGVSLTIAALDGNEVSLALIPHTLAATTLSELKPGDAVNLEADVLAKYVERLLPRR